MDGTTDTTDGSGTAAFRLSLLHSVLCAVNLGAIVLDGQRRVVLWNSWMSKHSGRNDAAALGQDLFALYPELRGGRVEAAVHQALHNHFPSLLSQSLNKAPFPLYARGAATKVAQVPPAQEVQHVDGERMQQAIEVTPIAIAGAAHHCLIQINDVSLAVARDKLLRDQAMVLRSQTYTDGLTGIANRRHFDVAMEKEWRRAKRSGAALTLLMIDIDYFKAYNDHYGHQQGDQCLIQVAAALSGMLKRPCDLMARYGGEEFAMILPETDSGQAGPMAEAMRLRVLELAIAHAHSRCAGGHVSVSIGIATQAAQTVYAIADLIGAADRALYGAKRSGRNRVEAEPPA
nr:diguanylate cyclase [Rugamonas sp.]